ncbi:MAG: ABC transporter substrate-binding protein [Desulfobacterales bacterium]|nr:ABC transporter substrate-binding protein [Desulfobacterales bacterium]
MIKKTNIVLFLSIILFTVLLFSPDSYVYAAGDYQVTVVVSQRIKPYMSVLEGMKQGWSTHKISAEVVFLLDSGGRDNLQRAEKGRITEQLIKDRPDLYVAVGPEAAQMVWGLPAGLARLYTAVLSPDDLLPDRSVHCGISLRIPVQRQVRELSMAFTNLKRIGLLFDKRNNNAFYEKAVAASRQYGIEIIPLQVESRDRIGRVLNENWQNIDGIWLIPDRTVISEKIIQYIIKQGIYNNKGVIGYNSYFIRSGAAFSFDFDYTALGRQTARKSLAYLETRQCRIEPPEFKTVINHNVADKLGLEKGE